MRNIKKLRLIAVIIILMLIFELFSFAFFSDNYNSLYWNSDISSIIEKGENADMIFVGTSRIYQGISPETIENELGVKNVCDAASAQQDIKGRYYLLKDMLDYFTPRYVVLEAGMNSLKDEEIVAARRTTMDRIRSLGNKLFFFRDDFKAGELLAFLPSYRFLKGESLEELTSKLTRRMKYFERKGRPEAVGSEEGRVEYYVRNGFITDLAGKGGEWNFHLSVSMDEINDDQLLYYQKMIDLCREKEIPVLMISVSLPRRQLYDADNYMGAYDFYKDIADKNDIFYANMNFHKEIGAILKDTDFADDLHLNGEGAVIESRAYAELIRLYESGADTSELFYEDLDDMAEDIDSIISVNARMEFNSRTDNYSLTIESAQPDKLTPEYRYQFIDRDSDEIVEESDYSDMTEYTIEKSKSDLKKLKLRAYARTKGSSADYECMSELEF